ncbi:phenylalanine aminomutase (L-beta-phenylalanine forming)-like [Lecanosticta acicola]|uniref:Phenylalanine aminomutase (L-beta-phenylalanine forming)-like n=1 Tax=Lecanosticta acicola TaxID=111012 RepID=A0AAI9E9Q8_9PEZI|nr:phenylalanine aminomutase (L-beta-phenylalanine forming)-like [Lecanosticta acicola]
MKNETSNGGGTLGSTPNDLSTNQKYGNHFNWTAEHHKKVQKLRKAGALVTIRGENLTPADLVAVSCHGAKSEMIAEEQVLRQIDASVDFLNNLLEQGRPVYGISTGFGGSADTRTSSFVNLQKALLQHHHSGIILPTDTEQRNCEKSDLLLSLKAHSLPRTMVRGAMLARCNSLMKGHSAVRRDVIGALLKLLNLDFIPVVPLRGSISASGDLTPLSYIAGALEGNPGIYVDCQLEKGRQILPSDQALQRARIEPITLGPKEGLGIMNGTTVSCAAATLGLHETQYLALLTQALTGMCTEALRGSADNYHPFIAETRPHPGHIEAAANMSRFLEGSKLAGSHHSGSRADGLYQDRYALRTAGQWLAPQLEDLCLAAQQLEVELNSTTDNPLIDPNGQRVHHGGNFQATSVTSATEKTRLCLQMFGKLLFAQNSELINPTLNGSLSPNLCFDDPSVSFTFKGVDINMASYMSELAFLANPVSSHVQPAEMSNQAVNSLALISARYTMDAVEIVSLMCAAHLYSVCQALDLQVMRLQYLQRIRESLKCTTLAELFPGHDYMELVMEAIDKGLSAHKTKDLEDQARATADSVMAVILSKASELEVVAGTTSELTMSTLAAFSNDCKTTILSCISSVRETFPPHATETTARYLSNGGKKLYRFVRNDLGVRLHLGLVEHATYSDPNARGPRIKTQDKKTIGEWIGIIYCAIRDGRIHDVLVKSLL